MPKANSTGPLSCLFAINKPTGHVSMQLLNRLQVLFASSSLFARQDGKQSQDAGKRNRKWKQERVKIGQGGTLDPLADGVLVIGTNDATKKLARFLECTKEYRAIGMFGCATDSYDSEGKITKQTSWDDVTREKIEAVLSNYRGQIEQVPPIYSALKMDGKPLYEYARTGQSLPRPIPVRKVTVSQLSLLNFTPGADHAYQFPTATLGATELAELEALEAMIRDGATTVPSGTIEKVKKGKKPVYTPMEANTTPIDYSVPRPPTFEISMTVSSGTYVRSIINDIAIALGSSAFVVKLTRTRQGEFTLNPDSLDSTAIVAPSIIVAPSVEPVIATMNVEETAPVETESKPDVATEATSLQPTVTVTAVTELEPIFSGGCIEWELLEAALQELDDVKAGTSTAIPVEGELAEWEKQLLHKCQLV